MNLIERGLVEGDVPSSMSKCLRDKLTSAQILWGHLAEMSSKTRTEDQAAALAALTASVTDNRAVSSQWLH